MAAITTSALDFLAERPAAVPAQPMTVDSTLPKDFLRHASHLMAEIQAINETIAGLPFTPEEYREARHIELVQQRVKKIEELRHLRTTIRDTTTPSTPSA